MILHKAFNSKTWTVLLLSILVLSSCSTTKNLPEKEQLYVGIAKTKVYNKDNSKAGKKALSAAEKVLNVPSNTSFAGSARINLGIPMGLWIYNSFVNDSTKFGKWVFDKFASEPIHISTVNPDLRSTVATNILREHGYFNAGVTNSVETLKNPRKARVHYSIDMQQPYLFDSVRYLPPIKISESSYLEHQKISAIKKGEQFGLDKIIADREKISLILRDSGFYYYKPDLLEFEADTLIAPQKVQIRSRLKEGTPAYFFEPWTIDSVVFTLGGHNFTPMTDSVWNQGVLIRYNDKTKVRKNVISRRVGFKPGTRYSQEIEQRSRIALSRLGAFAYTDFRFVPLDTANNKFILFINSTFDKPWDTSLEALFRVKSNNFLGPGAGVSIGRRNLFGGGENLSVSLHGNYEWMRGHSPTKDISRFVSYELGSDINLNAPAILLPFFRSEPFSFPISTDITLRASLLNRALFFRMLSFGGVLSYTFNQYAHKHTFTPLDLQFNYLDRQSEQFNKLLAENPILGLSLRSQLIPQIRYVYTYDNNFKREGEKGDHHLWMEYSISEAGNLINAIASMRGGDYYRTKRIFGVPFAQFVKFTADLHYNYTLSPKNSIATRFATGIIYSYGNMTTAPYSEQFYVGGANSVRAFSVRSVGPGRFSPNQKAYSYLDQVGEFKLEANVEWRMRLLGDLYGAVFLDAGNIWLLRPDEYRPGGSLKEIKSFGDFIDQIALGTGLGIRYDLNFFVIRLDAGFGLHLPYATSKKGYFNIPHFKDGFALHLAIGYPF